MISNWRPGKHRSDEQHRKLEGLILSLWLQRFLLKSVDPFFCWKRVFDYKIGKLFVSTYQKERGSKETLKGRGYACSPGGRKGFLAHIFYQARHSWFERTSRRSKKNSSILNQSPHYACLGSWIPNHYLERKQQTPINRVLRLLGCLM